MTQGECSSANQVLKIYDVLLQFSQHLHLPKVKLSMNYLTLGLRWATTNLFYDLSCSECNGALSNAFFMQMQNAITMSSVESSSCRFSVSILW